MTLRRRTAKCEHQFAPGYCYDENCAHAEKQLTRTKTTARRVRQHSCESSDCSAAGVFSYTSDSGTKHYLCSVCAERRRKFAEAG